MNNSLHYINIERSVLSSILFNYDEIYAAKEFLKAKDFYLPAHQKIYEAMIKLHDEAMPIDEEFIRRKVSSKDVDDSIIIEILSANPITNTMAYVREIKDASIKRELVSLATTIKKLTIDDDIKADEAIATITKKIDNIADDNIVDDFKNLFEQTEEFDIEFKSNTKELGFPTGIKPLDRAGVKFEPGDLVEIGARPSIGKTSLVVTMTDEYISNHNIGVLFDSLEMPTNKIIRSLIANKNEENKNDLKNRIVKDINKYNETIKFLKNTKNLIIHDKSYMPIEYYLAKARKIFRKNSHFKIWIIDHLKFIKSKGDKRYQEVGQITKSLKQFAKEFGITIVLLSQMGRPDAKKVSYRPTMSDLRESGDVEEDADIIILPHREDYYKRNQKDYISKPITEGELIVEKYRDGESKTVKTQFHGGYGKWGYFPMYEVEYKAIDNQEESDVEVPSIYM